MNITIITDNKESWFIPYGKTLQESLLNDGHNVFYVYDKKDIKKTDICFILSCTKIIENEYLILNNRNIVVHASDLPLGKGFSPLQWQILEGKNTIPITLFEVDSKVDNGPYYFKDNLLLEGTELYKEIRHKLAVKIMEMVLKYVKNIDNFHPITQVGQETFYGRRTIKDDELDIEKTIKEQFNHFRIADNDNFPLYFMYKNKKYILKVYEG